LAIEKKENNMAIKRKAEEEAKFDEKRYKRSKWPECDAIEVTVEGSDDKYMMPLRLRDTWLEAKQMACDHFGVDPTNYEMHYRNPLLLKTTVGPKQKRVEVETEVGKIMLFDGKLVLVKQPPAEKPADENDSGGESSGGSSDSDSDSASTDGKEKK